MPADTAAGDPGGQILVYHEGSLVQKLPLTREVITIGRAPDNVLVLPDPESQVSRLHAELRVERGAVLLTDRRSTNGTFVGTRRLPPDQPFPLADGAEFQIGSFRLRFQEQAVPSEPELEQQTLPPQPEPEPVSPMPRADAWEGLQIEKRPTHDYEILLPPRGRSRYLQHLPILFEDSSFLGRYLQIFEALWEPGEQRQDHIEMHFDPHTCPASFLPWLASWLDLSFNAHWPEARRRRLLARAMYLYRWRGTPQGLRDMIEVCTGLVPEVREDPTQPFVFHVRVTLPENGDVDRSLIEDLIQAHKPAYAGYVLEVSP